eukprot:CAMPEP_0205827572 /NCGR_PEP_ID=MMETSP0206-20130828/32462_1 /ASSEMBLY_ACC=CAM_ASM_000279 /TAXON_ID=36767 /ORGANISM="Euplotes focardii, Strain TN1" /LENGTH=298 /DNA_ID=CAMNT_0053128617 /DNA_START=6 /DNA_END=902 /DNA_ORIENTATION=+
MVLIHLKKSDKNQFLYESTVKAPIDELTKELVKLNNLRLKVDRLAVSMEELATKGPLKPDELRGLEDLDEYIKSEDLTVINGLKKLPPKTGTREVVDEAHHRTGWIQDEGLVEEMLEGATKAKAVIHIENVGKKICITEEALNEQIDWFRGMVMKVYPAFHGLGEWEPVLVLLENQEDFDHTLHNTDDLVEEKAQLWWAGKELTRNKLLQDYIGKNEKSKVIVKIQHKGSGAPVREPLVDEESHKKMLSYFHKKQEQQQKLEEDEEDQYLNSVWADPKQLKGQLHGTSNISFRPGGKF